MPGARNARLVMIVLAIVVIAGLLAARLAAPLAVAPR